MHRAVWGGWTTTIIEILSLNPLLRVSEQFGKWMHYYLWGLYFKILIEVESSIFRVEYVGL